MRHFGILSVAALLGLSGCFPQDMADQDRYDPLERSTFFENGMTSRPLVEGTVARGHLRTDDHFFTGRVDGELAEDFPQRVLDDFTTEELLARGEEQYKIYCSHCHGFVGGGKGGPKEMEDFVGMAVKRGFPMPPTYHSERLRGMPVGHFYDVITNGYGVMKAHGDLVKVENRWAITAWIRTLQLSQSPETLADGAAE